MALQQIKKVIIRDAIIENVLRYVEENDLKIGEKIPSERSLAAQMKVSRSSVREALKALEYGGILEIRHGGGAFLRSEATFSTFRYGKDQRENLLMLRHLIQARRMIEERVVVDATKLISPEQIGELYASEEHQLALAESGASEEGSFYELPNMNFELFITALLNNPVIYDMHQRLQPLWKKAFKSISSVPFPPRERYSHHVEIIKGMESGNAKAAEKAMIYHNRILADFIDREIHTLDEQSGEKGKTVRPQGIPAAGGRNSG